MGKIQKQDVKTVAELTGAGATAADLINDTQIYVTADGINKQLFDAIEDGDIGGGGGGSGFAAGSTISANHTLVSGDNGTVIFVESSSGAITITIPEISTLPADFAVTIKDYEGEVQSNPITIELAEITDILDNVANGTKVLQEAFGGVTLVKKSSTEMAILQYKSASDFILATGGTITVDGNFKVHSFTSSANFEITSGEGDVDYLIVGGGGGGGGNNGGGGGAGGHRSGTFTALSAGVYPVVVGGGGAGGNGLSSGAGATGTNGSSSSVNSITSSGGGGGGPGTGAGEKHCEPLTKVKLKSAKQVKPLPGPGDRIT